jgi:hypothetical protein
MTPRIANCGASSWPTGSAGYWRGTGCMKTGSATRLRNRSTFEAARNALSWPGGNGDDRQVHLGEPGKDSGGSPRTQIVATGTL